MKSTHFHWSHAIWGYVSYLLAIMINSFLTIFGTQLFPEAAFNIGALFNVTQFVFAGIICLLGFRLISRSKLTRQDFGIHRQDFLKAIGIGSVAGLLFFGISEIVETNNSTLREAGAEVMNSFNLGQNFTSDFLLLLSVGLFAPVVEEIIFRGAIFNPLVQGLKKYTSIPSWLVLLVAIAISAFAFISIHGGGGQDEQMVLLALLAVFACLTFYFTKSLFAAIFVHAVNNNLVFILMVYKAIGFNSTHGIMLALLSVVCLLVSIPLTSLFGKLLKGN